MRHLIDQSPNGWIPASLAALITAIGAAACESPAAIPAADLRACGPDTEDPRGVDEAGSFVAHAARFESNFEVREVPPPVFADPNRRDKIAALSAEIRGVAAQIAAEEGLVGLAIGVVVDGELVIGEGLGSRHAEEGGSIDTRTAFRIGSITKVFTGMTVLGLSEAGRLDLDAAAAAELPPLQRLVYPTADARPLTARDILSHVGGLPRDPDLPSLPPGEVHTRADLMEAIDGLSLLRAPGLEYEYSNLGFALLGHLVAAVSGRPYEAAIREAILDPLGMNHTVWEPEAVTPDLLTYGHFVADGRIIARPPQRHGALSAAGGLFSTVEDLARFAAFQLDAWPPRGDGGDAPLSRAIRREAQRLRALRSFRARTVPGELAESGVEGGAYGVGLAWDVTHGCEHPYVVGHSGATEGYRATIRLLPYAGIGVIVLANAGWADTDHLASEIQRVLDRGGALARRIPQPLPELDEAAARILDLFEDWDESTFAGWSTHDLRGGPAAARLAERMRWLNQALGACTLGPLQGASSPWSATYQAQCERGEAELALSLTSASTPKISSVIVRWIDGSPAPAVQEAATAAAALLVDFDEAKFRALFSPGFNLATMERIVALTRFEHGACHLDRALAVEGPEEASLLLECERGAAKMSLRLDRGQPARIVSFQVVPWGAAPACR